MSLPLAEVKAPAGQAPGPASSPERLLFAQSAAVFAVQALAVVCGLLNNLLVAWMLGPAGKGLIYLLQFLGGATVILLNLGLGPAAVYFTGRERRYAGEEIASGVLWSSLVLGAAPLFLVTLAWPWAGGLLGARLGGPYLWLALVAIPGLILAWTGGYWVLAQGRVVSYNVLRIAPPALFLASLILLAASGGHLDFPVAAAWVLSVALAGGYAAGLLRRGAGGWRLKGRRFLPAALRFGWRSHLGAVTQFLQHRVDILLVAHFLPLREVGQYSVAVGVAELLWNVPNTVASVLMPHVAGSSDEHAKHLTSLFCRSALGLTAALAVAVGAASSLAIPWLLPAFRSSVPLIWMLIPGVVAASVFKILSSDFNGRGRPLETFRPAAIALTVSVTAGIVVVPRYGVAGAACVTSAAYLLNAFLYLRAYARITALPANDLLVLRREDLFAVNRACRSFLAGLEMRSGL
jgi:O-antigen/teichoic acid export membrane protein